MTLRPLERSIYPEVNRWDKQTWAVVGFGLLLFLTVIVYMGIKIGSAVVAHQECAEVKRGTVMKSNTNDWLYCHVYEK